MKRNFGSLNLAALDLNRPSTIISTDATDSCSLEDQFSAMGSGTEDYSMDACSESSSDENVGLSLEHFQLPATDVPSASPSLREETSPNNMKDDMAMLSLPIRTTSVISSHVGDSDVRTRELQHLSSSEASLHPHDQVELNALRCLGLKVMLSSLSTSSTNCSSNTSANASIASNKPSYTYPGVNDRAKTTLLPIRHPSLQSV